MPKKKQFRSESRRLLELMVNSIYTHREIFLRELISNASDAIDKLRYIAITDSSVGLSGDDFAINIYADRDSRKLTISDNGVGMTASELEENLGVIAKSGTLSFREKIAAENPKTERSESAGADSDDIDEIPANTSFGDGIIGQFGVGFYSAFMVAKHIEVVSRAYGEETASRWESDGADGYTISEAARGAYGTDIILSLRDDTDDIDYSDYLEEYTIQNLVKKYSDYIRWPIISDVTHSKKVEKEDGKSEWVDETAREPLNSRIPIWQRPKSEVSDEDANEFFKEQWNQTSDPCSVIRVNAEGSVSYRAMLFIPKDAPIDYYSREYEPGLKLYASGVMIMERCADLLPDYFRFVRGVVDSPDLSLNISREMLQHDRQLKIISQNLEKRIRADLARLLENERENYEAFWRAFGLQLKFGLVSDYGVNRDNLRDLVLMYSSKERRLVSLKEYAAGMLSDQKYIYYAVGQSTAALTRLPQTELLLGHGYDVLLLTDEIDDFVAQSIDKYEEKELRSVRADDLGITSEEEKHETEEKEKSYEELLKFVAESLPGRVAEAKLSSNLGSSASALGAKGAVTLEMERYFELTKNPASVKAERILELNADHKAFKALERAYDSDKNQAKKIAETLCALSELQAGVEVQDPRALADNIWELMG